MAIKKWRKNRWLPGLTQRTAVITDGSSLSAWVLSMEHQAVMSVYRELARVCGEKERIYRDIVENAQVLIMRIDQAGQILFINDFGAGLFGYQQQELTGQSFKEVLLPELESTGRNLWLFFDEAFANPEQHRQVTCEVLKKDGSRIWLDWKNRLLQDGVSGKPSIVSIGINITEWRRLEAKGKRSYERYRWNQIFDNVLHNRITEEEFLEIVNKKGCCLTPPFVCFLIVFRSSCIQPPLLPQDLEDWQNCIDAGMDLLYASLGGTVWYTEYGIAILQTAAQEIFGKGSGRTARAEKISEISKDVFRNYSHVIGVSSVQTIIKEGYKEAYEASRIGPVFYPEQNIYQWDRLGVNRLIADYAKSPAGLTFIHDYLGPLLEKPSLRNYEWLLTLKELISGDSMNEMAARLHIHPKTLAFRKRKIERVLRVNLDDPEEGLNIAIALKMKQLREKL